MKSMTLPHKSSNSSQSNSSIRCSIYDVNFQSPDKYLNSSAFIQILNKNEIETKWSEHLNSINEEKNLIKTFYLFKCLFKETKRQLSKLSVDYYNYLVDKKCTDLDKNVYNMIQLINKLESPCLYFDQKSLMQQIKDSLLVDEHRKLTIELNDKYDQFKALKNDFNLNKLNDSIKLSKLWPKLVTHFMIILQIFTKLILNLTNHSMNLKLEDRSDEFSNLKRLLNNELNRSRDKITGIISEAISREQIVNLLVETIEQKNFMKTIFYFDVANLNHFSDQLDLDDCVLLACEHSSSQSNYLIICFLFQ